MDATIKAIETVYKNYRFRSRLEARWAVFFDTLGVRWEYEPEGFELGDGVRYLPDFWLPDTKLWVEIKPSLEGAKAEWKKLVRFGELADAPLMVTIRPPAPRNLDDGVLSNGILFNKETVLNATFVWFEHLKALYLMLNGPSVEEPFKYLAYYDGRHFGMGPLSTPVAALLDKPINAAFAAARQARFEHGEYPCAHKHPWPAQSPTP